MLQKSIKVLRTDGGTEYKTIARAFPSLIHQTTCPYTPQQNGVSERKHRHIIELALVVMTHASIPTRFWDDIFASVVYLINRQPPSNADSSPFFKIFHKSPDYSFLRVLGCSCFPYTRPYNKHKLQARSTPCVFLGYALSQKGYKCYHIDSNKMIISRHVVFDEQHFPFTKQPPAPSFCSDSAQSEHWLGLLPVITSQQQLASPTASATANPYLPSYTAQPSIPLPQSAPALTSAGPSAVVADPHPSSLDTSHPGADTPLIAANQPHLLTYSRHYKPSTGPSAPAADPGQFKSTPNRATPSTEPPVPISSTRLTSTHSMVTRSRAKITNSTPTALTADIMSHGPTTKPNQIPIGLKP